MKIIYILISFLICVGCKNNQEDTKDNKSKIPLRIIDTRVNRKILENGNQFKHYIETVNNVDSSSNGILNINISFTNKAIANDHQRVIIEYLTSQIDELKKYNQIVYRYKNSDIEDYDKLSFTKKQVIGLTEDYNSQTYKNLITFALKEFDPGTSTQMNIWIENVNYIYPELLDLEIFSLLHNFSQECEEKIQTKKAKATIVVMFVAVRKFLEGKQLTDPVIKEQPKNLELLKNFWAIGNDEMIEFAEQRLFGSVGNQNFPEIEK